MFFTFKGKKITDIVSIVPKESMRFEDEIEQYSFSREKSLKLMSIMGFREHRIAPDDITAADLCACGFDYLVRNRGLDSESIDALIFVSHTPDYILPPTSSVLHGKLGLKEDCYCVDINHGCAGYVVGLQHAFMLLETRAVRRVALLNGDTLSRKVNKKDRNSYPVVGDAGSVTIVENDDNGAPVNVFLKNRGKDALSLQIPAGGFRQPSSAITAVVNDAGDGNFRSQNDLVMEGASVFSFVQSEVPEMVEALLSVNRLSRDEINAYVFHQPNRFMLEKLADKIGIERSRMPNNIVENFGNSNSVTIPVNLTFNFADQLTKDSKVNVMLCGFGVGLTWGGLVWELGNLNTCNLIEYGDKQ